MSIEVRYTFNHFTIYVNGAFYCTCDSESEVDEELENLKLNN